MTDGTRDFGLVVGVHKVTTGGLLNWIAAAALGAVASPALLYFALTTEGPALKSVFGAVVMAVMTAWALHEAVRLRRLSLTVYEQGMNLRLGEKDSAVRWEQVLALEARYVPGLRKRGVSEEGNCVSFLVLSSGDGWLELPKELESFTELRGTIAKRTGHSVRQVLIQNLTER